MKNNLREEEFILAYGFSPRWHGSIASGSMCAEVECHGRECLVEQSGSPHGRQESER
jgi:hypothetical protein